MSRELEGLEQRLGGLSVLVSAGRIRWLRQRDRQKVIKSYAHMVSLAATQESISAEDLTEFIAGCLSDETSIMLALESIAQFLEKMTNKDLARAQVIYKDLVPRLAEIRRMGNPAIDPSLESLRLRLSYLGVICQEAYVPPGEKFLLERAADQAEQEHLINMVETMRTDEPLSSMVYPMLLVYGSRAKGYAHGKDFDLAVLVRPGVGLHLRTNIQEALTRLATENGIEASFLEFWLEEVSGKGLNIRDFEKPDTYLGGNDMAHVLFEAVWMGHSQDIRQIFRGLVSRFLLPATGIVQAVKGLLLKEMERNTLQFRLMHKGYFYMYPPQGGIATRNSSAIDSQSSFWDSGYRQLATKLFITKVLLPHTGIEASVGRPNG
jgi:hypothetical protein